MLNAQLTMVYFSELAINTCELKVSWQQVMVDGNLTHEIRPIRRNESEVGDIYISFI